MTRIVIAALIGVIVVYLVRLVIGMSPPARKRVLGWIAILVSVAGIVLLFRYGLHWLAVVGTALLGGARKLAPLALRLVAMAPSLWRRFASKHARNDGGAGSRSDGPHAGGNGSTPGSSGSSEGPRPARGGMSPEEARDVLGVSPGASREEIMAAYKNLIRKVHPDTPGGSTYLASKLNQARQTLIG